MSVENPKFTNNTEIVYHFIKITFYRPLKRESIGGNLGWGGLRGLSPL